MRCSPMRQTRTADRIADRRAQPGKTYARPCTRPKRPMRVWGFTRLAKLEQGSPAHNQQHRNAAQRGKPLT